MSNLIEAITLAIVQGITEFLPVSSSAHLILVPALTGWDDQGLAFDVAVHVGSLLAVLIYFRQDIIRLLKGFFRSLANRAIDNDSRLAWQLILATLPIGLIGIVAHDFVATQLRSPLVIAGSTICFGLVLFVSDYYSRREKSIAQLTWKDTAIIGFAQALALIPGTSRSGITLTAGLALGFDRKSSATFSFLLSIPVIVLAGSYEGYKIFSSGVLISTTLMLVGMLVSSITAYACIHFFMQFIQRIGMLPFVLYRFLLGGFLIVMFV